MPERFGVKCCRNCGTILDKSNWFPSYIKGYNYRCKPCSVKINQDNRKKRGSEYLEKRRSYGSTRVRANRCSNLQRNYGITADEWDSIFLAQGSCCKICGTFEKPKSGWHTDHCHTTGAIRGILCHSCNIGLGKFKDSPELLEVAIKYLNSSKENLGDLV